MIKEYVIGGREGGIDWCSLTSSITDKVPLTTTPNATLSNATSGENKTAQCNRTQYIIERIRQIGLNRGDNQYIDKGGLWPGLGLGLGDIYVLTRTRGVTCRKHGRDVSFIGPLSDGRWNDIFSMQFALMILQSYLQEGICHRVR